jgi:protein MPE1
MKKVEKPAGATEDGLTDESNQGGTIMLDADGNHVIVAPDTASWEKEQAKLKASAAQQEASVTGSKELQQLGLECPIDKRLFVEPMKTPCCGKTYCSDCIENALADNDLTCPNCGTEDVILDNLTADDEMVAKIKKYEDDKTAAKLATEEAKSPKPQSPGATENTTVPEQVVKAKSKSPTPDSATIKSIETKSPQLSTEPNPKKRPASEELENKRSPPKAPKAMLREQVQAQGPVPPGFDQNFIEQMNKFAPPMNGTQQAAPFFPQNMNPMGMPMNGMIGMPAMGMAMNPMMGMPQMMGMPNNMMNPMMMGRGMNAAMGFQQNGMAQNNNFNNSMMQGNGFGGPGWQGGQQGWVGPQQQQMANGRFGSFPNQQRQMFAGQGATDEENAYVRKPVNPHRAQNRQRRQARHNDYNTL